MPRTHSRLLLGMVISAHFPDTPFASLFLSARFWSLSPRLNQSAGERSRQQSPFVARFDSKFGIFIYPVLPVKIPEICGELQRMNRTIKDATVKRFHYDDHEQLKQHLADFIDAYNFGRRLKRLKALTPYEFICKRWTMEPHRFIIDPIHKMPGLNTLCVSAMV